MIASALGIILASSTMMTTDKADLYGDYVKQDDLCRGSSDAAVYEPACKKRDEIGAELWPRAKKTYTLQFDRGTAEITFDGITAKFWTQLRMTDGDEVRIGPSYKTTVGLGINCRRGKPSFITLNAVNIDPADESAVSEITHPEAYSFSVGGKAIEGGLFTSVKARDFAFAVRVPGASMAKAVEDIYDNKTVVFSFETALELDLQKISIEPHLTEEDRRAVGQAFQFCEMLAQ